MAARGIVGCMFSDREMLLDDDERGVIDIAMSLTGRAATDTAALVAELHRSGALRFLEGHDIDADDELIDEVCALLAVSDRLWVSSDQTQVIRIDQRLDGAVFTHRLTAEERERGSLDFLPDLAVVEFDRASDEQLTLADGSGSLELVVGGPDDCGQLVGPIGWLDGFEPGNVLALQRKADTLVVTLVTAKALGGSREADLLRAAFDDIVGEHATVAELHEIVLDVMTRSSHAWRSAVRPVGELLTDVGLASEVTYVGVIGTDFALRGRHDRIVAELADQHRFGQCCEQAFAVARRAFHTRGSPVGDTVDGDTVDGERVTDRALGEALVHSDVARALFDYAGALGDVAQARMLSFTEALAKLHGKPRAGGAFLMALLVETVGQSSVAEGLVEQAITADPTFFAAREQWARWLSLRGNVDAAIESRRHLQLEDDDELAFLLSIQPPRRTAVGRNDPCPCGSGRKYKQCCIDKPATLAPTEQARWLQRKLVDFALAPRHLDLIEDLVSHAVPGRRGEGQLRRITEVIGNGLVATWSLFEGSLAVEFLDQYAEILPTTEVEMLTDWLDRPTALLEVLDCERGATLSVKDMRTDEVMTVHDDVASKLYAAGDLLASRIGLVDGHLEFVAQPVVVDLRHRDATIELLDGQPTAEDLASWYAATVA